MNEKRCQHHIAPSVFFGDRELIELNYINGHYNILHIIKIDLMMNH